MYKPYFTEENSKNYNVYDEFEWKFINVDLKDYSTGESIYTGNKLVFPEHYSQQACEIIASKYFFRNIDGKGTPETSLGQVVHRMVMFWTDALIDEGLIEGKWKKKKDRSIPQNGYKKFTDAYYFYNDCVYTLLKQMWAPNSPQWFNSGIYLAYGIKGEPDFMYYYEDGECYCTPDRYSRSQTSACFIIPIADHLLGKDSISEHYETETKLFKGGSGVGTNFSTIRADGEALSNGGKSSGVMSFLLGLDRNAGAIKSGGTTRRAAKMVILDVDHPDIEEFIDWKVHEEKKARDLISLGYEGGMNGEAYQTVSGQNSNNSVRVSKDFMNKVLGFDPDPYFTLLGRVDHTKDKEVNAKKLWDKICTAAWECADPGVQFDDIYNEWNTVPNEGRINATNPCSEFAFIDNSACNLASINVGKFIAGEEDDKYFNTPDFLAIVHMIQMVLEASIHWGHFPTPEIAKNSYKFRPTGLGICNLATLFLNFGYSYDSDEARDLAGLICSLMTAQSYITSSYMAMIVGACEGYEDNKTDLKYIIKKHGNRVPEDSLNFAKDMFKEAFERVDGFGVRNMQVTVLAPTGTISLAMDCAATGIEPFFSHKYYKKCSDGSVMEMVNEDVERYLEKVLDGDYSRIDIAQDYYGQHHTYQGCPVLSVEQENVLKTANELSPIAHVNMMAAMQPFISGSISKTVNLPNDATVQDVKDIYELAYTTGCKSISIYRDGSKGTQPLNTEVDTLADELQKEAEKLSEKTIISAEDYNSEQILKGLKNALELIKEKGIEVEIIDSSKKNDPIEIEIEKNELSKKATENMEFTEIERVKPDGIRQGYTHSAKIGNIELYVTVSYYKDGGLCEIFVSSDKEGTTTKGLLSSLSKSLSHMLQYGIEPEKIAAILRNQQYEPAGHVERHPYIKMCTSISDFIARVIEFECGDYSRMQIKPTSVVKYDEDGEILWKDDYMDDPESKDDEQVFILNGYDSEYTGNECQICHSYRMVRNGNCEVCLDCGNTSGCS